jgi:hypothetical protein
MGTPSGGRINDVAPKTTAPNMALSLLVNFYNTGISFTETDKKKNSHHQSVNWPKKPGNTVPPAAPTGPMAPNIPTHTLRMRPGGKAMVSIATRLGTMIPPPMPLRARITITVSAVLMKPVIRWNRTYMHAPKSIVFLCP